MKTTDKRTKIIATIGPATHSAEKIEQLFDAGMTTVRLNFSHGDHKEQGDRIVFVREVASKRGIPISIALDTKGPEIRVGKFQGGKQPISVGQKITIFTLNEDFANKECGQGEMTVAYDMSQDLEVGKTVLVDDGKLQLEVIEVTPGIVKTIAKNHHVVKTNKRVNLPGTKFSMPFLAEKDKNDIRYGAKIGVDYIFASFVNTPEDINEIKDILKEENSEEIMVFAKIESQYAVDNFDAIVESTDGVMVARGDLGLEIPYYEVPVAQKMMIRKMRDAGKPVIVATQMLDSMESNPQPTRAEVSDVYLATELGADATMLSGESAAGEYPVESVQVMATINMTAEREFYNKEYYKNYLKGLAKPSNKREEIAMLVTKKAQNGDFKYSVVLSKTGKLLNVVSKFRPNTAIIGVTENEKQITKFGAVSSVFVIPGTKAFISMHKDVEKEAKKAVALYGAEKGDKFLVVENEKVSEFIF
ncbi:MAG: pyruvate kinase [Mollicutes bacterium PWAP]|nr:pyruvate kinase [Mollicutes bacterium PWAP]